MENQTWDKLPVKLLPLVKQAVDSLGFPLMKPVQSSCIPLFLSHKDVSVEAVTGSGKTLAFLIPVIQILLQRNLPLKKHDIGALIILPTRELATQVYEVLQRLLKFTPALTSILFIGGSNINANLLSFTKKGAHIIVSTPGRLKDLLSKKIDEGPRLSAGFKALDILILDEADKILDCGFFNTVSTILAYLPKQRRTGIFSATQTQDLTKLIHAGLRNPVQICVKDKVSCKLKTPALLKNFYIIVEANRKFSLLWSLLITRANEKCMVFFSTCLCVEYFSVMLQKFLPPKFTLFSLHGKMKAKRFKIFDQFRKAKCGILVCTDLMGRGVDIPQVDWVFQFDPPLSPASFVHRCGRTARNGEPGSSLLMLLPNEEDYVTFIELNQNVKLKQMEVPEDFPDLVEKMREFQLTDRSLVDQATKAFVTYIQSYLKQECSFLISLKKLNFGLVAMGFALIKLPRMPELKRCNSEDFVPYNIDWNSIKYSDPDKEEERLKKLAIYKKTGKWPGLKLYMPRKVISWAGSREKKEKKKLKKTERRAIKSKNYFTEEDLKDMEIDYKVIKKVKRSIENEEPDTLPSTTIQS